MNFIAIYENSLPEFFCNSVIDLFEKDTRKQPGRTRGGYKPHIKKSLDLNISSYPEYHVEDELFFSSLQKAVLDYGDKVIHPCELSTADYSDTGYQIQKTTPPDGQYVWHNDFSIIDNRVRVATFIWYLNTVEEGGHTEFITGEKIKPEQGKLILFPATWERAHRGMPPISGPKYICTGWITAPLSHFTGTVPSLNE